MYHSFKCNVGTGTRPARSGTGAGDVEGRRRTHPGRVARQAPGCLSRPDGEGTKSRCSFLFLAFVEHQRAGTTRSAGHTPYRTARSLSSIDGKAAPAPHSSGMELATWIRVHLRLPVSGWKLGTEETSKQKPNKQREPLQKGPVQQIKIPEGNTDYTGRGL